ncbi:MAG: hypothetical protein WCC25_10135 [Candidatus Korobacteraceae bacterium]
MARKYKIADPYLIPDSNLQRCSVCGYPFPADVKPPMSVAFAEHLWKTHQLEPTCEEAPEANED